MAHLLRIGLRAGPVAAAASFAAGQYRHDKPMSVQCDNFKSQISAMKFDPKASQSTLLYKNFTKRYGSGKGTQLFFPDVQELLREIGIVDQYIASRLFKVMDADRSGSVSYDELAKFCSVLGRGGSEAKMRFIFDACDLNENGKIESCELRRLLRHMLINCQSKLPNFLIVSTEADVAMFADLELEQIAAAVANRMVFEIFNVADTDKGGTINFKEFQFWYKRGDKTVKAFNDIFALFDLLVVE